MVLCKKYKICEHKDNCPYSKPLAIKNLHTNSNCYNFVSTEYYNIYLRKLRLEKIEKIEKNIK